MVDAVDEELLDELSDDVDELLSVLEPEPAPPPDVDVLFEDDVDDRLSVL